MTMLLTDQIAVELEQAVRTEDAERHWRDVPSNSSYGRRGQQVVVKALRAIATALGRVGTLAYDSRDRLCTKDQELASFGVTWASDPADDQRLAEELLAKHRYPTLSFIDRARDAGRPRFAADLDADWLERRARELAEQFWSDTVWVTGMVPEAAFRHVCEVLERERAAAAKAAPITTDRGSLAA